MGEGVGEGEQERESRGWERRERVRDSRGWERRESRERESR